MKSTAILWTGSLAECCATDAVADAFFQRRLYMKVFPMVPFPNADHSIAPSQRAEKYYTMYGGMFKALVGATWLLEPHAVRVHTVATRRAAKNSEGMSSSTTTTLVANAFETARDPGFGTLWAVMLGGATDANSTVVLNVSYLPPDTNASSFLTIVPGAQQKWNTVPRTAVHIIGGASGVKRASLSLRLERGCALVRTR
jgi:hypothetical protein